VALLCAPFEKFVMFCVRPPAVEGYVLEGETGDLSLLAFNVGGIACNAAEDYVGTVVVSVCTQQGGAYGEFASELLFFWGKWNMWRKMCLLIFVFFKTYLI